MDPMSPARARAGRKAQMMLAPRRRATQATPAGSADACRHVPLYLVAPADRTTRDADGGAVDSVHARHAHPRRAHCAPGGARPSSSASVSAARLHRRRHGDALRRSRRCTTSRSTRCSATSNALLPQGGRDVTDIAGTHPDPRRRARRHRRLSRRSSGTASSAWRARRSATASPSCSRGTSCARAS